MKYSFLFLIACLLVTPFASAQNDFDQKAREYVNEFKDIAIAQQVQSGVPAAITLAQGILETSAGCSELCQKANNHFGIKCKNSWSGETYTYTDDAQNECFRKYANARRSYEDHSRFLRNNPRYASLFSLNPLDYKAWAKGLKKCGYATNPVYAAKLIGYIEKYNLETYTDLALKEKDTSRKGLALNEDDRPAQVENASFQNMGFDPKLPGDKSQKDSARKAREYYKTTERNGLKGFYAPKGDLLLEYAIRHRIRYSRLLGWNDLQDRPLPADLFIYLEPKRKKGLREIHVVQPGETMLQVSQEEGIQLAQLKLYNKLEDDVEPVAGEKLFLLGPKATPPKVYEKVPVRYPEKQVYQDNSGADDYVETEQEEDITVIPARIPAVASRDAQEAARPVAPDAPENKASVPQVNRIDETSAASARAQLSPSRQQMQKAAVSPQKELSPLEKLKAYMDKVVYAEKTGNEKDAETSSSPAHTISAQARPVINTLPPRKTAEKPSSGHKTSASAGRFYTVQKGDTAFGIAKKYKISLQQLKEWNHLPKSMVVNKGQKLRVAP